MSNTTPEPVNHAVVLAGGLGTRLSPVLKGQPKVLAPLAGRPFIDWKLDEFARNGITHVTLLLGHGSEPVITHLEHGNYPFAIETIIDGPTLRGTGGAVMNVLHTLESDFFLTYGDSLLDMPYADLATTRNTANTPNALAVTTTIGPADRPNCQIHDGLVTRHNKQDITGMTATDYGLMIFNPQSLIQTIASTQEPLDLAIIVDTLARKHLLAAHTTEYPYWEIGTPESLIEATQHFLESKTRETF